MDRMVVLLSGGIESLVVAALARAYDPEGDVRLHGLFVDYGQVPREQERRASRTIAREYGIVLEEVELVLPFLDGHPMTEDGIIMYFDDLAEELGVKRSTRADVYRSHVVPYRNLMFTSMAASLALHVGADQIWTGFDYRPDLPTATADKSPAFVRALDETFAAAADKGTRAPRIVAPLQGNSKVDTIRNGEKLKVKWSTSWSCYNGLNFPCGVCAQCLTRIQSFAEAGVDEGVEYHSREFIREQLSAR